jgi:hypothetical protein
MIVFKTAPDNGRSFLQTPCHYLIAAPLRLYQLDIFIGFSSIPAIRVN